MSKDLSDITNELERYRLQQIESKQQEQSKIIKPLTDKEREAAIYFLQSKNSSKTPIMLELQTFSRFQNKQAA